MVAVAYRLRSTLRSQRGATTGLAVVIAIVCGIVLAIGAGAHRTSTAPDRYTKAFGAIPDGLIIQLEEGAPRTREVAQLSAVSSVDAFTFLFAGLTRPGSSDGLDAAVFAGSFAGDKLRVVRGRAPDPRATDEFVGSKIFADKFGATIGERFDLLTYTQEEADSQKFGIEPPTSPARPAVMVGIVDGPTALDDPTPLVMFPSALIEPPTFGISQTLMAVSLRSGFDLADLRAQLDDLPGGQSMSLQQDQLITTTLRRAIDAQARGLWLVALVAGIAATAVLGQLVTRHIRLTAADRDRLAAIGFTRGQIFTELIGRAAVPILLGCGLACVIAVLPSDFFPTGFVRRLEPNPGTRIDAAVLILGAAIVVVGVLAWTAAAVALDQRPAKAVRPSKLVERVATSTAHACAATGLRFAFTRKTGERGSTTSAVLGVALVVGGLVAAAVFGSSLNRLVNTPDRYGSNYDYAVGDNGGTSIDESLTEALRSDPDVTGLTLYAYGAARVGEKTVQLVGMQPVRGNLVPKLSAGRAPTGDDEVALGLVTARALGVGVGDSITMVGATSTLPMHVTGIAVVSGFGPVEGMGEGGVVTFAGLQRLDDSRELTTAAIDIRNMDPETLTHLAAVVGVPPDAIPEDGYRPAAIGNVARVRATPFVLAALLGGLAVLSVVHVMMTSLRKRRRDLAVLAALGADRGWIRRAVHWQATTFTILPVLTGIPLGIVAGRFVFVAFADSMGAVDEASTPLVLLAAMGAALLVLANAAAVPSWPARTARPADGLRTD